MATEWSPSRQKIMGRLLFACLCLIGALVVPSDASAQSDCTEVCVEFQFDDGANAGVACVDQGTTTLQDNCAVLSSDYCATTFCRVTMARNDSGVMIKVLNEDQCRGSTWRGDDGVGKQVAEVAWSSTIGEK